MDNMQGGARNERIICRLFLRNRCTRGDTCPYYHPEYDLNPDSPSVSWLNFCEDFQRGQCLKQDCRHFHVTREEEEAYRMKKDIAPTLLEQAMRKALLLDVALTGTRATCKEFLHSGCSLPMCPYRHISRQEFAKEVLNTLRNEFEILLGASGTDIPGLQLLPTPAVNTMNTPPIMNPIMPQRMGQGRMPVSREDTNEKRARLERENEEIYRALDPNQKVISLEEIRVRLLTLQAALQWKDENDTNKGGFVDDGLPPGMAVVNYDHSDSNFEEPNIDFMRRRNALPMQPDQGDNRPDPESHCKLFIGGLDSATETATLRDYFSSFGKVVDAVVMQYKNINKSRGFGFVTFAKAFMAENAQSNGPHRIGGKVVDTKFAKARGEDDQPTPPKPRDRPARSPNRDNGVPKLFVGGLSDNISTAVLIEYFSRYGKMVDSISMKNPKTKQSRGFGFVQFEDHETAQRVLADVPHRILGCNVTVDRPMHRDGNRQSNAARDGNRSSNASREGRGGNTGNTGKDTNQMFVGGLHFTTTERTVQEYFNQFGTVLEAKIVRDTQGGSKGYGFVTFSESSLVEDAIDNGPHEIEGRRVDTGYAARRSDSKKEREPREAPRERRRSPDFSGTKLEEKDGCKLHIGNLPKSIKKGTLEKHFMEFGDIIKLEIKKSYSVWFGFVTYSDPQMVEVALASAPHEIDGCVIEVAKAVSKGREEKNNTRDRGPQGGGRRSKDDNEAKQSGGRSGQNCRLYVGQLDLDTTEETLHDYFCKYGNIKNTKVPLDSKDLPKGHAFITFSNNTSAQEAMDDGPHEIDGRQVKLELAMSKNQGGKDQSDDGSGQNCRLYVGKLDLDTTEETLYDYFGKYGEIKDTKMPLDPEGLPKGHAFITFSESLAVNEAIEDGPHEIDGREVNLGLANPKSGRDVDGSLDVGKAKGREEKNNSRSRGPQRGSRRSKDDNDAKQSGGRSGQNCRLYVGHLDLDTTEETLHDYFCQYGEIKETKVPIFSKGLPRGHAFITFSENHSVQEAMDDGPHEIDGREVKLELATSKSQGGRDYAVQSSKLFIGQLDVNTTEETLSDYFCKYGKIKDVNLPVDSKGDSRRFAFITFNETLSVQEAMEDGPHEIDGCQVNLGLAKGRGGKDGDNRRDRSPDSQTGRRNADKRKGEKRSYLD